MITSVRSSIAAGLRPLAVVVIASTVAVPPAAAHDDWAAPAAPRPPFVSQV